MNVLPFEDKMIKVYRTIDETQHNGMLFRESRVLPDLTLPDGTFVRQRCAANYLLSIIIMMQAVGLPCR
jgi:hypothetical protein